MTPEETIERLNKRIRQLSANAGVLAEDVVKLEKENDRLKIENAEMRKALAALAKA